MIVVLVTTIGVRGTRDLSKKDDIYSRKDDLYMFVLIKTLFYFLRFES